MVEWEQEDQRPQITGHCPPHTRTGLFSPARFQPWWAFQISLEVFMFHVWSSLRCILPEAALPFPIRYLDQLTTISMDRL